MVFKVAFLHEHKMFVKKNSAHSNDGGHEEPQVSRIWLKGPYPLQGTNFRLQLCVLFCKKKKMRLR